ncbi:hypothetical protein [Flavobacterium coralii]|uniref:hypothetical protein n=1 Tax=Flavobacterium coralii TaxID=2838017 RepID=UPI000C4ABC38|nr:hypothetical protein [Flavobacterium sp.]|tara:strand:+ start:754 stop:1251 length:498 start_codon:yes stop_codon:yes gene_type:complete
MKIILKTRVLLITLFLLSFAASAQVTGDKKLAEQKSSTLFTYMKCEPVCWKNASNEFNVYVEREGSVHLFTFMSEEEINLGPLPEFEILCYSKYFFALHSPEDVNYYFTVESEAEEESRNIVSNIYNPTRIYSGAGIAHHTWTKDKEGKPSLDKLKAAKSIYDAM